MNYKVRVLPTRDVLMKTAEAAPIPFSPEAPALVPNLINAGYLINQEIISYMENEFGISEGKFVLLMALKTIPKGCSIKELAARVGVSVPTISVMLSRMRAQTHPLIAVRRMKGDAREKRVTITKDGLALLDQLLPGHFKRVMDFAGRLTPDEQKELLALLDKLLPKPEAK